MEDAQKFTEQYFAAAEHPDPERCLAFFADDAVVHDDGRTHRGIAELRAWHRALPTVRYTLRGVVPTASGHRARARVGGDFPGSPVTLRFTFERDTRGRITLLTISP
ncbi:nuclear transport factor 2 family protein [Streptomyces parvulus]|uniref:nuclear transport factor 2 family protein n=1 Tax=Streptomyces parvulus TaxID=146923 RepID=UPI001E5190C3|nr:nuclear transport factor 2 family protein [Streptomyces parvulus]MCC9158353.1 nuclear transport factor 2 family protein [Streptomyces parvulus]MCE7690856.1 nuclear transport factor 2 family protein [Streptomyces parvulus]